MISPITLRSIVKNVLDTAPGLLPYIDDIRQLNAQKIKNRNFQHTWPTWCYFPKCIVSLWASQNLDSRNYNSITELTAMSSWRATQGIYTFDHDFFTELNNTSLEGKIPIELLSHLPEWCLFINFPYPLPMYQICNIPNHENVDAFGFFVFVDYLPGGHGLPETKELYLLFLGLNQQDSSPVFHHVVFLLSDVYENLYDSLFNSMKNTVKLMENSLPDTTLLVDDNLHILASSWIGHLSSFVSMVLYLCSVSADIRHITGKNILPSKKLKYYKTKRGLRQEVPQTVNEWEVGFRIGPALRKANARSDHHNSNNELLDDHEQMTTRHVRAHVRRAHWHSYWTGSIKDPSNRKRELKWISPILVGKVEQLIPTIHDVEPL